MNHFRKIVERVLPMIAEQNREHNRQAIAQSKRDSFPPELKMVCTIGEYDSMNWEKDPGVPKYGNLTHEEDDIFRESKKRNEELTTTHKKTQGKVPRYKLKPGALSELTLRHMMIHTGLSVNTMGIAIRKGKTTVYVLTSILEGLEMDPEDLIVQEHILSYEHDVLENLKRKEKRRK